jgi:hypothetical protein
MASDEIHVGDVSTVFRFTVKDGASIVDISDLDTLQVIFRKPDGTTLTKTATYVTDGTDGLMKYIIAEGDIDVAGMWRVQGRVSNSEQNWYSDIQSFKVFPNL